MIRHRNFLETGKLPKIEQVVSSRKHLLFRSYQKDVLQTHITKRLILKDETMMDYYKTHIYNNILPYLRKVNHGSLNHPLKMLSSIAQITIQGKQNKKESSDYYDYDSDQQQNGSNPEIDGSTLFLSKKMIPGKTLRQLVIQKDDRLDRQFCRELLGALLDFTFKGNGIKDLLITSENIIVSECGVFHMNYFSFVGIDFFRLEKYISREQFQEILPFLTVEFMEQNSPLKTKILFQMQLKFILLNFYIAFFKRDLMFDFGAELQIELKKNDQKVKKVVQKVTQVILPQLLSKQDRQQIRQFDKYYQTHLQGLLIACMKNEKLIDNWERVLFHLSKTGKSQQQKIELPMENQFEQYEIQGNQNKFSENIFQLFDLYIEIIKKASQSKGQIIQKYPKFKDLNKKAQQLQQERMDLLLQKRYSKSLYVPIKFGMHFSQIMKYKNWVDMLNTAEETDRSTLNSLVQLIKFCLQIRQHMILLAPQLDINLFRQIFLKKEQQKQKGDLDLNSFEQSFYQFIGEQISQKANGQEEQRQQLVQKAEGKCEVPKYKQIIWEQFFWILNQLMLLAKRFFLRTTRHSIYKLKINRHDFSSIIKLIDDSIPFLGHAVSKK